ncbi:hypothetical protein [Azospira oryzae]|uniref:hypothetical protein n=1 Tax=Azospira oryzae TaxID=146939 RepID=UPI001964DCC2|nr:hypothetical protein [Azospira oryzae]
MTIRKVLAGTSFVLALSACVTPQGGGVRNGNTDGNAGPTPINPISARSDLTKIEQTPLKNIFAQTVSGGAKNPAFPRVALHVLGIKGTPFSSNPVVSGDGCMVFSATIWHSASHSEKVKEFNVCTYDLNNSPFTQKMDNPYWKGQVAIFYQDYEKGKWQTWIAGGETKLANSGYKRTDGPLPPRFALDQDNMSSKTWRAISSGSVSAYLMYAMRNMGYMINRDDMEGRFWIVDVSL